ncbi:MAG: VPLPA-CTERM sorting domain-containing protein [Phycisphaerales bacterium]|nr:VPLPA-CTERM sorting domain-containing protein [Phycisphaerales bacterium]
MKNAWIVAAAATAAVSSSSLANSIIQVNRVSGYHQNIIVAPNVGGGEFTVSRVSGGGIGETGLASDIGSNSFQTFCVELNQSISNGQFRAQVNDEVLTGAPGFSVIMDTTAWLYVQFRRGGLASIGYDYDPNATRVESSAALQLAIWNLQGQFGQPGQSGSRNTNLVNELNSNQLAQDFIAAANAATSNGWQNTSVRVLNVGSVNGTDWDNQDLLTLIPLPSGGGLAAAGLMGLVALRRRRA